MISSVRQLIFPILVCSSLAFSVENAGNIVLPDNPDGVIKYAGNLLVEKLNVLAGCDYKHAQGFAKICLRIDPDLADECGTEGFRLLTDSDTAVISAGHGIGLRNGVCYFIEWVMGRTTAGLVDQNNVDIDFPVVQGQAKEFLKSLPKTDISQKPFYPNRIVEMANLALGVADLIDTPNGVQKYNSYDGTAGGYKETTQLWKGWCDWCARHKMNYITNWPYSGGNNFWEMAVESTTAKMSIYSPEEIAQAAAIREQLFKYAQDRGVKPLLMNYIPGAPTAVIRANRPELLGQTAMKQYPQPFCLSSPAVERVYTKQAQAIMRTYPSLAGLHLRWAGESFPCNCELCRGNEKQLQPSIILKIVLAARQERKNAEFICSGCTLWGLLESGFLNSMPSNVVAQAKWGLDWEPTSNPGYSLATIANCPRPFVICQNMPTEEQQPIGGVMYKHQQNGMKSYAMAAKKIPNLAGWIIVTGEKDRDWITATNFIAAAKLNWDPLATDVNGLIRNYLVTKYGKAAAEPVYKALDISQDVWEAYSVDFDGVVRFYKCSRLHDMFGLERVGNLSPAELKKGLAVVDEHAGRMKQAVTLIRSVESTIKPEARELFRDMLLQEEIFAGFLESRKVMAEAFLAQKSGSLDEMTAGLKTMIAMDKHLQELVQMKPNMSDDFEMSGMTKPTHIIKNVTSEINDIEKYISAENIDRMRFSREIYCNEGKLRVAGDVGTEKHMSFTLPPRVDNVRSARFYFTVEEAGGENPGEEAQVELLGTNYKIPPSGDGTHVFSFDIDASRLSGRKTIDAVFRLVSAGFGSDYTAQNGRLVLELQKK